MEAAIWGIIGGLITWAASWAYYKKAGDDLSKEAAALRKQSLLIMNFLDNASAAPRFVRDPVTGEPTSVLVQMTGTIGANSSVSGSAQVTRADGSKEPPIEISP